MSIWSNQERGLPVLVTTWEFKQRQESSCDNCPCFKISRAITALTYSFKLSTCSVVLAVMVLLANPHDCDVRTHDDYAAIAKHLTRGGNSN